MGNPIQQTRYLLYIVLVVCLTSSVRFKCNTMYYMDIDTLTNQLC